MASADEKIRSHLINELGAAYKDLAAAKEEDNAAKASEVFLFSVLLVSIVFACLLIFFRIGLNSEAGKETLERLKKGFMNNESATRSGIGCGIDRRNGLPGVAG